MTASLTSATAPATATPADPSVAPRNPAQRLLGLEALRGIGAACVVLLHLQATFGGHPRVFGKGYLAVDFFLMLSGLLMARAQEAKLRSGLSPRKFMVARYKRLWPMMALGALIGAPTLFLRTQSVMQFLLLAIPNLFLLPVSFNRLVFPLNIPAWTIFYELVANALHTVLFWRWGRIALAAAIAALLPILCWIGLSHGSLDVGARPEHFILGFPRIAFAYLIGIALGRWWRDAPSVAVPPLVAFAAMPVLFVTSWALHLDGWLFDLTFVTLACPLILAGGMRLTTRPALARFSGVVSFPLFAVHMPILQAGAMIGLAWPVGGLLAFGGGIVVAILAEMRRRRGMAQ